MIFQDLSINPLIINAINDLEYQELTEVQEKVLPIVLSGDDCIGQAPTGTGKTICYTLPILEKLDLSNNKIEGLILVPTRELALQVTNEFNKLAKYMKAKALAIYGGEQIEKQITGLRKKPKVIVSTPGRLLDHMSRQTLTLNNVKYVVLDEADEMLNMGFIEDIDLILSRVSNYQMMLFSATYPNEIERIASKYMNKPKFIKVGKGSLTAKEIEQFYCICNDEDKIEVLSRLMEINEYKLVMIFCNTKKNVDDVTSTLLTRGFVALALHGDMKQIQRERVMERYRSGEINILVASDVAARGLDIDDVDVVFNYDLPTDPEYYVHRIGRTGRIGKTGLSIALVNKRDVRKLKEIIKYAKVEVNTIAIPSLDKIIKVRTKRLLNRAISIAKENNNFTDVEYDNNKYLSIIEKQVGKLTKDYSEEDKDILIKGLLSLIINAPSKNQEIEDLTQTTLNDIKSRSGKYRHGDVRMFISIGRSDNIKVFTITDMLIKHMDIDNANINDITICDNYSFFNIPKDKVSDCLSLSNEIRYKGKRVLIEVAKEEKNNKKRSKKK